MSSRCSDNPCFIPNPLGHGGTSQNRRALKALLPESIQMDERRTADLILFADKYARLLSYYNGKNSPDGDWGEFIAHDISTLLARISRDNHKLINDTYAKYLERLEKDYSADHYQPIFDILFTLFKKIDLMMDPEIYGTPFHSDLINEIEGRLQGELERSIAYYKGRLNTIVVNPLVGPAPPLADDYAFKDVAKVLSEGFSLKWVPQNSGAENWQDYFDNINADTSIYGDSGWPDNKRIEYSVSHIKALFNRLYGSYLRLIKQAGEHLSHSLEKYPFHRAHNALLLTFFKLFKFVQEDLNQMTEHHLRFYFRQVLRLEEKPSHPDSVHVLVQLAGHKRQHPVRAGTELKAGKDESGKELVYTVDSELTANKASVDQLKTIFIDVPGKGIYSAGKADSADGAGEEELDPLKPYFRPFGQPQKEAAIATMASTEIGWAVASPILRLKGGIRTLTFIFLLAENVNLDSSDTSELLADSLEVSLSGSKGWITCNPLSIKNGKNIVMVDYLSRYPDYILDLPDDDLSKNLSDYLSFPTSLEAIFIGVTLTKEMDSVVDFDAEKIKDTFDFETEFPVARFRIVNERRAETYRLLRGIQSPGVWIISHVEKLQDLVLGNDLGPVDPASPFQPFGPRPRVGSTFYIGSQEALSKSLSDISFEIKWMGLPPAGLASHYSYKAPSGSGFTSEVYVSGVSDNSSFKAMASLLKDGEWINLEEQAQSIFSDTTESDTTESDTTETDNHTWNSSHNHLGDADPGMEDFERFSPDLKNGFISYRLCQPPDAFGHVLFPKVFATQAMAMSKPTANANLELPNEPYTPTIESISCTYTAQCSILFDVADQADGTQFFHLHPFGYREVKGGNDPVMLVPPYEHTIKNREEDIQGALHIGLKDSEPRQTVSLLFQVAEGTEDFTKDAPDEVVWCFLENNEWQSLKTYMIGNTTNGHLGSGIVSFKIPKTANDDNTLMPKGLRWFRASISKNYDAFPQVMAVKAQALTATFKDNDDHAAHLARPLPAGTISKMVRSDSAIKKISQPYASFNGRMKEQQADFFNRASERLRHKNRAVTIWDYERLVLEAFPEIYKVKCLNHTNDCDGINATEMAPGRVRVVVVPDVRGKVAGNLFEPSVSNNTREKIKEYLAGQKNSLNSLFVDLKVENPRYEAVQVHCSVGFRNWVNDDDLYEKQLKSDIDKFLAPWAFDQAGDIEFGGRLERSVILKYVLDLPYVDYVTDFSLSLHIENTTVGTELPEVIASDSRSILTSFKEHEISMAGCAIKNTEV